MAKNDSLPPLGFLRTFDMLKKTLLGVQFNINSFCCNLFEVGLILSQIDWTNISINGLLLCWGPITGIGLLITAYY